MPKLCRCGKIVANRCECVRQSTQRRSTSMEGHGYDHRKASERYRKDHPLCERCVMLFGVMEAQPSQDMHHIVAICNAPSERMQRSNWLALCRMHHEELERDEIEGLKTKRWSDENYHRSVNWSVSNHEVCNGTGGANNAVPFWPRSVELPRKSPSKTGGRK